MGYENNKENYIIDNDIEDMDTPKMEKKMKRASVRNSQLPDNYEIEEDAPNISERINQEILEEAEKEGLTSDEGYLGGEGASPQQVIDALVNEEMPEGAIKNKEEYEEKKVQNFRKVIATRDLLHNRLEKTIPCSIVTTMPMINENGEEVIEPVELEFEVRRLSESENTHLYNHKLFGRDIADLTDEEYSQSIKFRSELLSRAVVGELSMTPSEWSNGVDYSMVNKIYEKVNEVLTDADDASLFQ